MQILSAKTVCCQVGRDVPACLQEALTRKGLDMRVSALVRKCFCHVVIFFHLHLSAESYVYVFSYHYNESGAKGLANSQIT